MSLINQMLHDLDARRAGAEERLFPSAVTPLPAALRPRRTSRVLPLVALALIVVAGGGWWWTQGVAVAPPPVVAPVAPPSVPAPAANTADTKLIGENPALRIDLDLDRVPADPPARRDTKSASKPEPRADAVAAAKATPLPVIAPPLPPVPVVKPKEVLPREVPQLAAESSIDKQPRLASAAERADAEYRRAILAQRQGNLEEAASRYRGALAIQAEHNLARQALVNILLEAKRYDDAEAVLQQGIELPASRLSSAMTLARLKVERGQADAASAVLAAHSVAGERSAEFQGFAGALMNRAGRYAEAVERYQAATRLAPNEARWWAGLGIGLDAQGKANEAREAYLKARSLPNLPPELSQIVEQRLR